MHKTIISDTSCFIILNKIDEMELLKRTFECIVTTSEIVAEFGEKLPEWVKIEIVSDKEKQKMLETQIDKGEASALSLALELKNSLLILDDYKARQLAENLHLTYTGTIGVIVRAKLKNIIPSIKPILAKIRNTDFRLPKDIETLALIEAGENE